MTECCFPCCAKCAHPLLFSELRPVHIGTISCEPLVCGYAIYIHKLPYREATTECKYTEWLKLLAINITVMSNLIPG